MQSRSRASLSGSRRIATIGAYDRFNYGDLLFPLALDYVSSAHGGVALAHFSPKRSDLSGVGGVPTSSLSPALQRELREGRITSIILGGGEILGATWGPAAASVMPVPLDLPMLALRRLGVPAVQDKLGKALLRGSWPTPYVPDEEIAGELPVIANAIGASSLEVLPAADQRAVIRTLRRSPYVSVRDRRGQQLLQDRGVDARLTPDSIAILSRIAPRDIFDSANDTLVVQASRAWLRGEIDDLARSIAEMSGNYASVRLLPIGLAGGHGDSQGLRKLEAALRAQGVSAVDFVEVGSVWDVARAIAGARLFVGTSLHGAITSMAFAVPFVPMSGVSKLSAYVDTWAGPIAARPATAAGLPDAAAEALRVSRRAREELAAELDALAWDNSLRVIAEAGVK